LSRCRFVEGALVLVPPSTFSNHQTRCSKFSSRNPQGLFCQEVKVLEDCVCVVRETHGEPTLPPWISGTKYCTVSIPTLTNAETKGTDPTKSTRGCYADGFVARSNIAKLKTLASKTCLKDLTTIFRAWLESPREVTKTV